MGKEYIPPEGTKLPFNFTEQGYAAPNSTSILFNFAPKGNFGTLKAAISVMQPHLETTYTYPKSCPKYVVGYGSSGVQIIKGRCLFGGIRDLQGLITGVPRGFTEGPLTAYINGILKNDQSDLQGILRATRPVDLPAVIGAHQPSDLTADIIGAKKAGTKDLSGVIDTHSPGDINAYLGVHQPVDLPALIEGIKKRGSGNLSGLIQTHPPRDLPASVGAHLPGNLPMYLRGWVRGHPVSLPALISGWQEGPDLSGQIGAHSPANLSLVLRGWAKGHSDLSASLGAYDQRDLSAHVRAHPFGELSAAIRGWHREAYSDLTARIKMWQSEDLTAVTSGHIWGTLTARVSPHPPPSLPANIRGWARGLQSDLAASTYGWQAGDIAAYAGGHAPGNLGIILKGVFIEAESNLPAQTHGWQELDLKANVGAHSPGNLGIILKGVVIGATVDLGGTLHGWQQSDLGMTTKGGHLPGDVSAYIKSFISASDDLGGLVRGWQELDLNARVNIHDPISLVGIIRPWHRGNYTDLAGIVHGWQEIDLPAIIGVHLPSYLTVAIRGVDSVPRDFPAIIHGWEYRDLGMTLAGSHYPEHLSAMIFAEQYGDRFLSASIYAWHVGNLTASLGIVRKENLSAQISPIIPKDLPAYLRAGIFQSDLGADTHGWGVSYLGAYLKRTYREDLLAVVNAVTDTHSDLSAKVFSYGSTYRDLTANTRGFAWKDLNASVIATYLADMPAYLFPVVPKNLRGIVHSWQVLNLPAILNVKDYPWNLTAEIYSKGYWKNLEAVVYPVQGSEVAGNLKVIIHPWDFRHLTANVFVDSAPSLRAYLNPVLQSGNLHGSIYPKMIRLTTAVRIPTMNAKDLSAIINFPCFKTGVTNLSAIIWAKYKGDLAGIINPIRWVYKPRYLSASVGYTDSYSVVDKLNIGITILPGEHFVEDKYSIGLNIMDAKKLLSAYIRATPRYLGLTAAITPQPVASYSYTGLFSNRERVIYQTYDGVFKYFETIEMSFKQAVTEYFYSSAGDFTWKTNPVEKWIFNIKAILPKDLTLRLKRRLHRAKEISNLRDFDSVDEAIRHAIAYVTETPQANLSASIYNRGTYVGLSGSITPRITQSGGGQLGSNIIPIDNTVIVSKSNSISKI